MSFDERFQTSKDGQLQEGVRQRLQHLRQQGYTLKELGDVFGFSGPFLSHLLNEKSPGNIRSRHIPGFIRSLENAEAKIQSSQQVTPASQPGPDSIEGLVQAIRARGFQVVLLAK